MNCPPTFAFRLRHGALPLALLACVPALAAELVVLVDTSTEMPMARFENGRLVDGVHKDVGEALAQQMGRTARFLGLPRKRVADALERGTADLLCTYVPEWLPGQFDWSTRFFNVTEVVVAERGAARPRSIADLAGKPIGTVLGFSYPELESVLGAQFVRGDGFSATANLRKLQAGRIHYAATSKTVLDYAVRKGELSKPLYAPLPIKSYDTGCAVSRQGHVGVAEVNAAIARLVAEGAVERFMRRYR